MESGIAAVAAGSSSSSGLSEAEVETLRSQLAQAHRRNADHAQRLLDAQHTIKQLQHRCSLNDDAIDDWRDRLAKSQSRIEFLDDQCHEKVSYTLFHLSETFLSCFSIENCNILQIFYFNNCFFFFMSLIFVLFVNQKNKIKTRILLFKFYEMNYKLFKLS